MDATMLKFKKSKGKRFNDNAPYLGSTISVPVMEYVYDYEKMVI
jgi:hypothetical protein